ncbi:DUF1990 domain-containing protein [Rhodococcus sp. Z13]|uniref:DUF1990 domain-containing protein n=1 Tax=Rhodococcus sacchari TaxID=2962047 RepID=A0ACD4DH46_9NOCA|nr:DUF1990 domain-containing protein [Rhodococcus sp. Z13]UYP19385.1 DUF1990 domain-containing protein [Rhodococcus sp. Z13]
MPASGRPGRDPTYPEVGASLRACLDGSPLPSGYRHLHIREELGRGDRVFEVAATRLFSWQMHRAAGIAVPDATPSAAPGVEVLLGFGIGPVRATAGCRVLEVVDDEGRRGFTYGTLPGHPECGEETFLVEHAGDGRVTGTVIAFSRPARWYTRLAGPVGHLLQRRIARRYLDALRR